MAKSVFVLLTGGNTLFTTLEVWPAGLVSGYKDADLLALFWWNLASISSALYDLSINSLDIDLAKFKYFWIPTSISSSVPGLN